MVCQANPVHRLEEGNHCPDMHGVMQPCTHTCMCELYSVIMQGVIYTRISLQLQSIYASYIYVALQSSAICVCCLRAMSVYLIMYGSCLPKSWRDEDVVSIMFYWGDFNMLAWAESIIPMATCTPFVLPVAQGGMFRSYTWSGHVTELLFGLYIRST